MPFLLFCALAWSADAPPDEPELMAELRSMMGEDPAPKLPNGSYRMFTFAPLILRDDGKLVGVTGERLRVSLLEHARDLGWPAVGADDLLFDRDRSDEAQLVVGGEVQRVYEADVLGDSGWVVEVRWEVLDRARDAVVYSVLTRFIRPGDWDEGNNVDIEVTRGALERLLRRPAFVSLLAEAAPAEAAASGPITLSACRDANPSLPSEMNDVVARTMKIVAEGRSGTGVMISPDGFLLTAAHVITGATATVVLDDRMKLPATLVRMDHAADVALLKVAGSGHRCLTMADEPPTLGEQVFLVGYPLGELSVSSGVVSGLRTVEGHGFLQTDAATNPGMSGGPLLDGSGKVLGVMSWKLAAPGLEGLAFAVPPDAVADALVLEFGTASDTVTAAAAAPPAQKVVDAPDPEIGEIPTGRVCVFRAGALLNDASSKRVTIAGAEFVMRTKTWFCHELPRGSYGMGIDGVGVHHVSVGDDEDTLVELVTAPIQTGTLAPLASDRLLVRQNANLGKIQQRYNQVQH